MRAITLERLDVTRFWLVPVAMLGALALAAFAINPLAGLAAIGGLGIVAIAFRWPDLATLVTIFAIYLNVPAVLVRFHHVPKAVAASVGLLLLIPLFYHIVVKGGKIIIDKIFLLMLVFLMTMLASTILARDLGLAVRAIADFAFEGLVIYFLISNVIRDVPTLKRTMAMMLLAGSLMGALTIFQKATHTMDKNYGGFAQAGGVFGVGENFGKTALEIRPNGPIGEQNRFAQVLVVLIPLASLFILKGESRIGQLAAMGAAMLILGGMVLTFSRGSFLGLTAVVILMAWVRYIKAWYLIPLGVLAVAAFLFSGPGLSKRLETFEQIPDLLSGKTTPGQTTDISMRRRLAENLAALNVFEDNPVFGVGPSHFARYYSTPNVVKIGLAAQDKGYFAHNLYLEIAADTGSLGLLCFLVIAAVLVHSLWKSWRSLRRAEPDLAYLAGAFLFSCIAYLTTAVFLQLSFQRYFWLLVALAYSCTRLIPQEIERRLTAAREYIHDSELSGI